MQLHNGVGMAVYSGARQPRWLGTDEGVRPYLSLGSCIQETRIGFGNAFRFRS